LAVARVNKIAPICNNGRNFILNSGRTAKLKDKQGNQKKKYLHANLTLNVLRINGFRNLSLKLNNQNEKNESCVVRFMEVYDRIYVFNLMVLLCSQT
jgi:hypothetical protein